MNIPQYKSRSSLKCDDTELTEGLQHSGRKRTISHSSYRQRTISTHEEDKKYCICLNEDTKDALVEMLDFSLFKNPLFLLFTLSNFCTSIGFNIPYVYLVPRGKALGLTGKEASLLLSVIGIANTVSRIVLGYLSDKPWINRLWVYNICLTICGIGKSTYTIFILILVK